MQKVLELTIIVLPYIVPVDCALPLVLQAYLIHPLPCKPTALCLQTMFSPLKTEHAHARKMHQSSSYVHQIALTQNKIHEALEC